MTACIVLDDQIMVFSGSVLVGVALFAATLLAFTDALPTSSSQQEFQCTTEQHRPRYHFSAKKNWINDPNGMVYYDGVYHLFFQYHPDSMNWGPMHWGHAISRDLSTWEHLPIALYPDEIGTIFSGSAVVDFGNTTGFKNSSSFDPVVAIYTSAGQTQTQSLAYSLDGGMTFAKYPGNPVLNATETFDFRDPKVRFHDGQWVMTLAVWDRVEFYVSPDLKTWTKESEIGRNPPVGSHEGVWECPDLLSFNVTLPNNQTVELWVLFVSISNGSPNGGTGTFYMVGNFTRTNGALEFNNLPWTQNQWIEFGLDNYAGVTFSNEPKRREIYMGWITNGLYSGDTPNLSHRGQFTIPRQLGIHVLNHTAGEYRLTSTPVPELIALRNPSQFLERNESLSIAPQTLIQLTEQANFTNPLMELEISLEMRGNPQFSICAYNNVSEEVCFGYNGERWHLDRSKSGNVDFHDNFRSHLNAFGPREITDESTTIRIFLDVSTMEVFADGGLTVMTALYFPSQPFDKFYINHWSESSSRAEVTVNSFRISGLECWFPENEEL